MWPVGPTTLPPEESLSKGLLALTVWPCALVTCWPEALGGQREVQGLALWGAALGSPGPFPVQLVLQLP